MGHKEETRQRYDALMRAKLHKVEGTITQPVAYREYPREPALAYSPESAEAETKALAALLERLNTPPEPVAWIARAELNNLMRFPTMAPTVSARPVSLDDVPLYTRP